MFLLINYLKPEQHKKIDEKLKIVEEKTEPYLEKNTIKEILTNKEIPNEIKIRTKNIYGIYIIRRWT